LSRRPGPAPTGLHLPAGRFVENRGAALGERVPGEEQSDSPRLARVLSFTLIH
jgi:hypothetical protein